LPLSLILTLFALVRRDPFDSGLAKGSVVEITLIDSPPFVVFVLFCTLVFCTLVFCTLVLFTLFVVGGGFVLFLSVGPVDFLLLSLAEVDLDRRLVVESSSCGCDISGMRLLLSSVYFGVVDFSFGMSLILISGVRILLVVGGLFLVGANKSSGRRSFVSVVE